MSWSRKYPHPLALLGMLGVVNHVNPEPTGPKRLRGKSWWGTPAPKLRIGPANSRQVNRHLAMELAMRAVNQENPKMPRHERRNLARAYRSRFLE